MVNKKTLLLILLGALVLPTVALADAKLIADAVKTAAVNVGTPLVIVGWLIAGILYLTSAGSPERTGIAKKAIVAAVIGTLLVLLAAGAGALIGDTFGLPSV